MAEHERASAEPLTDAELAALADAAAKATPGPWEWSWQDASCVDLLGPKGHEQHVLRSGVCAACQRNRLRCTAPEDRNMDFIAAANPATVARLVAELRAAREEPARGSAAEGTDGRS